MFFIFPVYFTRPIGRILRTGHLVEMEDSFPRKVTGIDVARLQGTITWRPLGMWAMAIVGRISSIFWTCCLYFFFVLPIHDSTHWLQHESSAFAVKFHQSIAKDQLDQPEEFALPGSWQVPSPRTFVSPLMAVFSWRHVQRHKARRIVGMYRS